MDRILAYELKQLATQIIDMPVNAQTLTVQDFHGSPTLYALTQDAQEAITPHVFHAIRTGMPFIWKANWRYIATYQVPGFQVSWNIFEEYPISKMDSDLEAIEKIVGGKVKANLETIVEVITDPPPGKPVNVANLPKSGKWERDPSGIQQQSKLVSQGSRWGTLKERLRRLIAGGSRSRMLVNG